MILCRLVACSVLPPVWVVLMITQALMIMMSSNFRYVCVGGACCTVVVCGWSYGVAHLRVIALQALPLHFEPAAVVAPAAVNPAALPVLVTPAAIAVPMVPTVPSVPQADPLPAGAPAPLSRVASFAPPPPAQQQAPPSQPAAPDMYGAPAPDMYGAPMDSGLPAGLFAPVGFAPPDANAPYQEEKFTF